MVICHYWEVHHLLSLQEGKCKHDIGGKGNGVFLASCLAMGCSWQVFLASWTAALIFLAEVCLNSDDASTALPAMVFEGTDASKLMRH